MATPISNSFIPSIGNSETGNITWNGNAIPCLGICVGDNLNRITYLLANKICELISPQNLSHLTLQGALDIFNKEESGDRTLLTVLQLLIDNEVGLNKLISNLQDEVRDISTPSLVLNLRCFRESDKYGNTLSYTTESVLQSIIDWSCKYEQDVIALAGTVGVIRNDLNNLINAPLVINEKSITTCINPSSKPVSQHLTLLATDYCAYKTSIGSVAQIQSAISKQPSILNTTLFGVAGFSSTPENEAVSIGNLWLAYTNLQSRVKLIEDNCCKITCKNVEIGYNIIVNSDSTITLQFSTTAGTSIPSGMLDRGSVLTLEDKNGVKYSYNISIAQEATIGDYTFNGLDTSANIKVNVDAKLGMEGLECSRCVNKEFNTKSGCEFCTLTNNTISVITVVYKINSVIKSVDISPEEVFVLPTGATIEYTTNNNGLTSSCDKIIPNVELSCYRLGYSVNLNISSSPNLEEQDTEIRSIYVGGVRYLLNEADENNIVPALTSKGLDKILLNMVATKVITGGRYKITLKFKTPSTIGDKIELELVGPAYEDGLFVKAIKEDCITV